MFSAEPVAVCSDRKGGPYIHAHVSELADPRGRGGKMIRTVPSVPSVLRVSCHGKGVAPPAIALLSLW